MNLVLDSGVLGRLCHPSAIQAAPVEARLEQLRLVHASLSIYIPEVADFEVRRKLLHLEKKRALARLDALQRLFTYIPIDTPTMLKAAELWAQARRRGRPTGADDGLDADVLLAAQALRVQGTVATTNVRHLEQFVAVQDWR